MKNMIAMMAVAVISSSAFASIFEQTAAGNSLKGVTVSKEANVTINNQKLPVSLIGYGMRKVVIVPVYVAELLSSDASSFVRNSAAGNLDSLNSLNASRTTVIRLNFVRDVDSAKIRSAFEEAYSLNNPGKDHNADAEISKFFAAVSTYSVIPKDKKLVIAFQKNADKSETLAFEGPDEKVTVVNGSEGFSRKVLAFWLGATGSELKGLRADIINGGPQ
jgi:hypothetical protein